MHHPSNARRIPLAHVSLDKLSFASTLHWTDFLDTSATNTLTTNDGVWLTPQSSTHSGQPRLRHVVGKTTWTVPHAVLPPGAGRFTTFRCTIQSFPSFFGMTLRATIVRFTQTQLLTQTSDNKAYAVEPVPLLTRFLTMSTPDDGDASAHTLSFSSAAEPAPLDGPAVNVAVKIQWTTTLNNPSEPLQIEQCYAFTSKLYQVYKDTGTVSLCKLDEILTLLHTISNSSATITRNPDLLYLLVIFDRLNEVVTASNEANTLSQLIFLNNTLHIVRKDNIAIKVDQIVKSFSNPSTYHLRSSGQILSKRMCCKTPTLILIVLLQLPSKIST